MSTPTWIVMLIMDQFLRSLSLALLFLVFFVVGTLSIIVTVYPLRLIRNWLRGIFYRIRYIRSYRRVEPFE